MAAQVAASRTCQQKLVITERINSEEPRLLDEEGIDSRFWIVTRTPRTTPVLLNGQIFHESIRNDHEEDVPTGVEFR